MRARRSTPAAGAAGLSWRWSQRRASSFGSSTSARSQSSSIRRWSSKDTWGEYTFEYGPATSSIWSTPSYDPDSNTLFFGTDVKHGPAGSPRRTIRVFTPKTRARSSPSTPPPADGIGARSSIPVTCGPTRMRGYDPETGLYKDLSIGDTPKILNIDVNGKPTKGGRRGLQERRGFTCCAPTTGKIVKHTPLYTGRPHASAGQARPARAGPAQPHGRSAVGLRHRRPNDLHQRHRRRAADHARQSRIALPTADRWSGHERPRPIWRSNTGGTSGRWCRNWADSWRWETSLPPASPWATGVLYFTSVPGGQAHKRLTRPRAKCSSSSSWGTCSQGLPYRAAESMSAPGNVLFGGAQSSFPRTCLAACAVSVCRDPDEIDGLSKGGE